MSDISKLFTPEIFPRFRNYTLIVLFVISGGSVLNFFGKKKDNKEISINTDGTFTLKDKRYHHFIYDASILWMKCPVKIEKGQEVHLSIEGKYLNTQSGMIYSANGYNTKESQSFYIDSTINKGQLLAQISKDGFRPKIKPNETIALKEGLNNFTAQHSGYLWFSSNQVLFYPYDKHDWQRYQTFTGDSIKLIPFNNIKPEPAFKQLFGNISIKVVIED